ncbi:MAG: hypothetical protein GF353_04740 [Candidatus Lokiarchaeota archaeon]|nr:hypothetical protein [Candidatus Lokiarchaeota archaeon]
MNNEEWLKYFEEAYKLPFREDVRFDEWEKKEFTKSDRDFLLLKAKSMREYSTIEREQCLQIVQIFTRLFFKKAIKGETFCPLEKIKSDFMGNSFEKVYGYSSGPFINLAKTYWTFRHQLNEDTDRPKEYTPLFYQILRNVETNIAGAFFPSAGVVSAKVQKNILKEFAPEIDVERFLSENPLLKRKSGCLGSLLFLLLLTIILIRLVV